MTEQESWRDRRWPTTTSVSIFLRHDARSKGGLVLVRQEEQWSLPGGGLKPKEYLIDTARREAGEEINIDNGRIFFDTLKPLPICVLRQDRTQVGHVFRASYRGPRLDSNGWKIKSDKIDFAKPFRLPELLHIIKGHLKTRDGRLSPIFKPHFNFPLFLFWVTEYRLYRKVPAYVDAFLHEIQPQVEHLEIRENLGQARWDYHPPCLVAEQDPEAARRKNLLQWGP